MLALGARISRALSRDGTSGADGSITTTSRTSLEGSTKAPSMVTLPGNFNNSNSNKRPSLNGSGYYAKTYEMSEHDIRSQSRGREPFSTGRGGAGNMRQQSQPAEGSPAPRGREPVPAVVREAPTSVGRGGAGNFRSLSKSREPELGNYERNEDHTFSTGRGGLGNIHSTPEHSRSRSRGPDDTLSSTVGGRTPERSQSRGRNRILVHSTGRGGAGNITSLPEETVLDDEHERALSPPREQGVHSTGRGGVANITSLHEPGVEETDGVQHQQQQQFYSTGRGGAGNIARSSSRGPRSGSGRSASRDRDGKHQEQSAIGKFIDHITGHGHTHENEGFEGDRGRPNEKAF